MKTDEVVIHIDGTKYGVAEYQYGWILYRKHKGKKGKVEGQEVWGEPTYHKHFEQIADEIGEHYGTKAKTVRHLLDEIVEKRKELKETIKELLEVKTNE
jgi:ribosomal protein S4